MSDSSGNEGAAPPQGDLADVAVLRDFIRQVSILIALGEGQAELLDAALTRSSEAINTFISDPQCQDLFVTRTILRESSAENESDEPSVTYAISSEYGARTERTSSLTLMKRGLVIDADKPILEQVMFGYLNEGNYCETMRATIRRMVVPSFKVHVKDTRRGGERDGDKLVPTAEKGLNEFEVALLHMHQNIDIPEIVLNIHPAIQSIIDKASSDGRRANVGDLGQLVNSTDFLNTLQSGVNRWIKEIQKVTKLDRDPASGTSLQEMTFWLNMDNALKKISQKCESDEITLTLEALKAGKRFQATLSFHSNAGLKEAREKVDDYLGVLKEIPLNSLMSATDLTILTKALHDVFSHLRKIRSSKYPIARALKFLEAISRDLTAQALKILGPRRLLYINLNDFDELMRGCFNVFQAWDDENEKLSLILRELVKKKREETMKMSLRLSPLHKKLEIRLVNVKKFRDQHDHLCSVIQRVLPRYELGDGSSPTTEAPLAAGSNALELVVTAYNYVREVDCLDISAEGEEAWGTVLKRYEAQIEHVEKEITARLRDQLGAAKSANEMFAICQRYNALFVRPHIRGAIRDFQTQLIQRVKEDIEALQNKFTNGYMGSNAEQMAGDLDIPPFSAQIIWSRQIESQLQTYVKRVEAVLGRGWENHVEGRQLKQDIDNFRQKLNTTHLFEEWSTQISIKQFNVGGRVYAIERYAHQRDNRISLKLKVNFAPDIIQLHKEVRNLKNMGFRIPLKIVNVAHQVNMYYPFAISLLESVRTYESINENIKLIPLCATE